MVLTFQRRNLLEVLVLSVCTWPVASPCLRGELSARAKCISRESEGVRVCVCESEGVRVYMCIKN